MAKPFQFTEALVKVLPVPDSDRIYHKDSHFPGLQLCITATGTRTYYYVRRMDGKPTRIRLGTTKQLPLKQARSAAATIAGEVATGKDPQAERRTRRTAPTLDYVWNQWLEAHAKPRKRSWREDVRMWDKCLTTFHGRRLASIRPVEVAQWHTQLGETSGKYLANRAKSLLNTLFTYAIGLELVVVSPCRSVPNFPEQSRERFLLPAEMKAFFDALGAVGEPWHERLPNRALHRRKVWQRRSHAMGGSRFRPHDLDHSTRQDEEGPPGGPGPASARRGDSQEPSGPMRRQPVGLSVNSHRQPYRQPVACVGPHTRSLRPD